MKRDGQSRRWCAMVLWLLLWAASGMAQGRLETVSGVVKDRQTGIPLRQANVAVPGGGTSTVTNDEGRFVLKVERMPERIVVSHVGYRSRYVPTGTHGGTPLEIAMTASTFQLDEVMVMPDDPVGILNRALERVPENYGRTARTMQTFYRETVQKRQRFIYIAEAVADLLKTGYDRPASYDRVAIVKGRRLLSPKASDTLAVKIQGGPSLIVHLDFVKNRDFIFNEEELANYSFSMDVPEKIGDRTHYVVVMKPARKTSHALYSGRFYVDCESYAFTRAELELDVSDRELATGMLLVKKPMGLKFRPKGLAIIVNFVNDGGASRISYVRTEMRFNCDWKRRLMSTGYYVVTEMVVTDEYREPRAIRGRQSFLQHDAFYDKVEYFEDADFWADYNIIEPTESLEKAVGKLKRTFR